MAVGAFQKVYLNIHLSCKNIDSCITRKCEHIINYLNVNKIYFKEKKRKYGFAKIKFKKLQRKSYSGIRSSIQKKKKNGKKNVHVFLD